MLLALKDHQLSIVTATADTLPAEKRSVFLDRVAARLRVLGTRFTDAELEKLVRQALQGLSQAIAGPAPLRRP
jgi:hypothetical protein